MAKDLSRIVDALPGLVWTALPDGHVDFLNQRWCDYTGARSRDACGRGWQAAIHPEDLPRVLDGWASLLEGREPGEFEARLRRFDGAFRWFLIRAVPLCDDGGQVLKWYGENTDIEDRKQGESLLEEEKRLLEMVAGGRSLTDVLDALCRFVERTAPGRRCNVLLVDPSGTGLQRGAAPSLPDGFDEDTGDRPVCPQWGPCATAAFSNEPVIATDMASDTRWESSGWRRLALEHGLRACWSTPIAPTNGKVLGALAILSREPGSPAPRDQHLIEQLTRIAGIAIERTQAADALRHSEAQLAGEKRLLEMVASGRSLPDVLGALCSFVEETATDCHCGVYLIDWSGPTFRYAAGPTLPAAFYHPIDGVPLHDEIGPCARAARLRTQVITSDVESDPLWQGSLFRPLALAHGLRSCWSTPIYSLAGTVLGTFAVYQRRPAAPTALQQDLIAQVTHIASIAIERAQGEAALRRSEAFLAQAQRLTQTGSLWWRTSTGEITWSEESFRLLDYPRTITPSVELILRRCHPEDRSLVQDTIARSARDGTNIDFEHRLLMPDGAVKHVHVVVQNVGSEAGRPEFVGAVTDITERKRAEEDLRRSEAYLAEGQRLSRTGSFGWNVVADEHYWSDETFRIFEYDASTTVTLQLLLDRVHPQDMPVVRQAIALATEGSDFDCEYRLLLPSGAVKHVHVVAHAVGGRPGRPEFVGAVMDVTATRRAEEALRRGQADLARVSRVTTLGALTASIAHEVNQPLSGIITNASTCLRMLAADPPNVEGARETARRTIRDGHRASDVITRLRALFGRQDVTTDPVDLNEAAREVIALASNELQRSRVMVWQELADDLPPVTGDRVQLQQVILNLLLNALEAMSGVEGRSRHVVISTRRDDDDRVRLTVQDAGVGLDPDTVPNLFDAFYTTKRGGMGIGLSVSRSIIESHHGRLWAAANDGPGATFSFSIPRRPGGVGDARGRGGSRRPAAPETARVVRTP